MHGETTDTMINMKPEKNCPICGSDELIDTLMPNDDSYDFEASEKAGIIGYVDGFNFIHEEQECQDCFWRGEYGPRFYYNSNTNDYDLKSPKI